MRQSRTFLRSDGHQKLWFLIEIAVLIATVSGLLFATRSMLFFGASTVRHDPVIWFYPIFSYFADGVLHHHIPLWNPFSHGGEPLFLTYLQLRIFDPLNYMVIFVGNWFTNDLTTIFSWCVTVRILIGGVGIWLLLRRWAKLPITRICLAPISILCLPVIGAFHQNGIIDQFYCSPYIGYFIFRILDGKSSAANWLACTFFLGQCLQSYFFVGPISFIALIVIGHVLFLRDPLINIARRRSSWLIFAACAGLLLLMSTPSLLALYQQHDFYLTARNIPANWQQLVPQRAPFTKDLGAIDTAGYGVLMPYGVIDLTGTPVDPIHFAGLLAEGSLFVGAQFDVNLFFGGLAFAVSLFGIAVARQRHKKVWLTILFGFGILILGPNTPIHGILYYIFPPLWFLRHTEQLTPYFILALLYFFVLGCDRLVANNWLSYFRRPSDDEPVSKLAFSFGRRWRSKVVVTLILAAATICLTGCIFVFCLFLISHPKPVPGIISTPTLIVTGAAAAALLIASCIGRYFPIGILAGLALSGLVNSPYPWAYGGWVACAILLPTILLATLNDVPRPMVRSRKATVLIAATVTELLFAMYLVKLDWTVPRVAVKNHWSVQVGDLAFPTTRVAAVPGPIFPAYSQLFLFPPPSLYIQAIRFAEVLGRIGAAFGPPQLADPRQPFVFDAQHLLSTSQISTFAVLNGYQRLIHSGLDPSVLAAVFDVDQPIFQFRPEAKIVEESVGYLKSMSPAAARDTLSRNIIIERKDLPAGWNAPAISAQSGAATITPTRSTFDEMRVKVQSIGPGFLYFANAFTPDWAATINGVVVPIRKANGNFQAVGIGRGISDVHFVYRPNAVKIVLWLFYVALAISGGLAVLAAARDRIKTRATMSLYAKSLKK